MINNLFQHTSNITDHHIIKHIHLTWNVDFERKIIDGNVQLNVEQVGERNNSLVSNFALFMCEIDL